MESQVPYTLVGTQRIVQENEELIQNYLAKLREELQKEPIDNIPTSEFINDDKFLLAFLRAEKYNLQKVMKLVFRYWEFRSNELGITTRRILISNIEKDLLDSDLLYLVPGFKDKCGRQCLYFQPRYLDHSKFTKKQILTFFWYVIEQAIEDETTQQYGIFFLSDPSSASISNFDRGLASSFLDSLQKRLPVRFGAGCIINPPIFLKTIIWPILQLLLSEKLRQRVKICPNCEELKEFFELSYLPQKFGGELEIDRSKWIEECYSRENLVIEA